MSNSCSRNAISSRTPNESISPVENSGVSRVRASFPSLPAQRAVTNARITSSMSMRLLCSQRFVPIVTVWRIARRVLEGALRALLDDDRRTEPFDKGAERCRIWIYRHVGEAIESHGHVRGHPFAERVAKHQRRRSRIPLIEVKDRT